MYDLSFSQEFFWNNSEHPEVTDKASSIYEALFNLSLNNRDELNGIIKDVLGYDVKKLLALPETIFHELTSKAIEYNTCRNLNSPVEVFINENYSVFVY